MSLSDLDYSIFSNQFIQPIMKRPLLLLLFSVSVYVLHAQDNYSNEPTFHDPNAASLGKYVDIPVSYHTGVPNISIPIYTVKEGELVLPVSLSYHASGIKVNEVASSVGLGWSLSAGGVISRSVNGAPDEGIQRTGGKTNRNGWGYYTDGGLPPEIEDPANNCGSQWVNACKESCNVGCNCFEYFYDAAKGRADSEPDLFSYSFNGKSGKFYFDQSGGVVLLPRSDIKIEVISFPDSWKIVDTDGTKYYFGTTAATSKVYTYNPSGSGSIGNDTYSTSSWYLYKIESRNSDDNIYLTYEADDHGYGNRQSQSISMYHAQASLSGDVAGVSHLLNYTWVDGVRLSSIISSKTTISLIPGSVRQDVTQYGSPNGAANTVAKSIQEIQISSLGICKSFELNTSYFSSATGSSDYSFSDISDTKRLKLNWIQEKSCDGTLVNPKHEFTYYESTPLPRRYSLGQDHWGYANGESQQNHLIPRGLQLFYSPTPETYANRAPNFTNGQAYTLKSIKYPTGGTSEFIFEAHKDASNNVIGGLRIKTVQSKDASGTVVLSKSFTYDLPNLYDGDPMGDYVDDLENNLEWAQWNLMLNSEVRLGKRITSSPKSILSSTQGYHIGYSKVTVTNSDGSDEIYNYTNQNPIPVTFEYPSPPPFQVIGIGRLAGSEYRDADDNIVSSEVNYHGTALGAAFDGIRISVETSPDGTSGCALGYSYIVKKAYSYTSKYSRLEQSTVTKDGVTSITNYEYGNNHNFPTAIISTNSNGTVERKEISYAPDLSGSTYTTLVTRNVIETPIIEMQKVDGFPVSKVERSFSVAGYDIYPETTEYYPTGQNESSIYHYVYNSNGLIETHKEDDKRVAFWWEGPKQISVARFEGAPIASVYYNSFEEVAGTTGTAKTGTKYYNSGSYVIPTAYRPSGAGLKMTFWYYDGTWKFQSETAYSSTVTKSGATRLDEIRVYPAGTTVTSYVLGYNAQPITVNDPNNVVTTFEYDKLGRLKQKKDEAGNILQAYDYNFK